MQPNPHPVSYEELIAYAAMEHAARQRTAIAEHVARCLDCAATVVRYEAVRRVLSSDDSLIPPATAVARAQALYISPVAKRTAGIQRRPWTWQSAGRIVLSSAIVVLVIAIGLAMAGVAALVLGAQDALPGDVLYPVKTSFEGVQLAASIDDASKIQADLAIARTRVTELQGLVAQGRYDAIPVTTLDYEGRVQRVTATLGQAVKQDPSAQAALAQRVALELSQYSTALSELQRASPAPFQSEIGRAVAASNAAHSNVENQLSSIGVSAPPTSTDVPPAATATSIAAPALGPATPVIGAANTPAPAPSVTPTAPTPPSGTLSPTPTPTSTSEPTATPEPSPTVTPTTTPSPTATPSAPTAMPPATPSAILPGPTATNTPPATPTLALPPTPPAATNTPAPATPSAPTATPARARRPTRTPIPATRTAPARSRATAVPAPMRPVPTPVLATPSARSNRPTATQSLLGATIDDTSSYKNGINLDA